MKIRHFGFDLLRLRSHLPQLTLEFLVIFLSITLSWWVEDYRQEKDDRQRERVILGNLNKNLRTDSIRLISERNQLEKNLVILDSLYGRISQERNGNVEISIKDALALIVIAEFHPARAEFEAIKSTGQISLIKSDSLVSQMMNLYEVTYGELAFILDIDRMTFTENSWPQIIKDFPLHRIIGPESRSTSVSMTPEYRESILSRIAFCRLALKAILPRFDQCMNEVGQLRSSIRSRELELGK